MVSIETLLRLANEKGASDLHITVGASPKLRINGKLIDVDCEKLSPLDTERIISPMFIDSFKEIEQHVESCDCDQMLQCVIHRNVPRQDRQPVLANLIEAWVKRFRQVA